VRARRSLVTASSLIAGGVALFLFVYYVAFFPGY
jgi:hypothetical protein